MAILRLADFSAASSLVEDNPKLNIHVSRYPLTGRSLVELVYQNEQLHRDAKEGPAGIVRDPVTGNVERLEYWEFGALHRDPNDGPAFIVYDPASGNPVVEEYFYRGKLHRDLPDEAAVIVRDVSGHIVRREFWRHGQRLKGPRRNHRRASDLAL